MIETAPHPMNRFLLPTLRPVFAALLLFAVACGDSSKDPVASVDDSVASVDPVSLLFIQSSDGAKLTDSTLTLTGVSSQTIWFTDRPYRESGQMITAEFISKWGSGADSFADDPPNAGFSCEVGGELVNYVVELTDPSLDGDVLSYSVEAVGDDPLPSTLQCDAAADLFIDSEEPASTTFTLIFLNNTGDDLTIDLPLTDNTATSVGSYPSFSLSNGQGRRVSVTNIGGSNAAVSFAATAGGTTYYFDAQEDQLTQDPAACINSPPQIANGDVWNVSLIPNSVGYRVQIASGGIGCSGSLRSWWDELGAWGATHPGYAVLIAVGLGTIGAIALPLLPDLFAASGEVDALVEVSEEVEANQTSTEEQIEEAETQEECQTSVESGASQWVCNTQTQ